MYYKNVFTNNRTASAIQITAIIIIFAFFFKFTLLHNAHDYTHQGYKTYT